MPPPVSLVLIVFTLFFIGFWCVILKIVSCFGWSQLAKRYSTFSRPKGTSYHWQSLSLGQLSKYGCCITFRISETGLYLEVFPLLALGHPPLYFHGLKSGFAKKKTVFSEKTTFTILEHHAGAGWQSEKKCTERSSVNYKMIEVFKTRQAAQHH